MKARISNFKLKKKSWQLKLVSWILELVTQQLFSKVQYSVLSVLLCKVRFKNFTPQSFLLKSSFRESFKPKAFFSIAQIQSSFEKCQYGCFDLNIFSYFPFMDHPNKYSIRISN